MHQKIDQAVQERQNSVYSFHFEDMEEFSKADGQFHTYKSGVKSVKDQFADSRYLIDQLVEDLNIKHTFIVQNIDYISNQGIPFKNKAVLENMLMNLLPSLN